MLDTQLQKIVLWLEKNPLATYSNLARKFKITPPTAKVRINTLFGKLGGQKVIYGVSGALNASNLNLEIYSFIIQLEAKQIKHDFLSLAKLADAHPYTSYYNRSFGGKINGLFIQFLAPQGSQPILQRLIEIIAENVNMSNSVYFPQPIMQFDTYPEISFWQNNNWEFDFDKWYYSTHASVNLQEKKSSLNQAVNPYDTSFKGTLNQSDIFQRLNLTDIILIRELMINARRKKVDIINDIKANPDYSKDEKELFMPKKRKQISKRLKFIENTKIFREFRVRYNREILQLNNQIVFFGSINKFQKDNLIHVLRSNTLPFRTSLRFYSENNFYWWMNLPPKQSSQALNLIFEICSQLNVIFLDTLNSNSAVYPIWHKNFQLQDGKNEWKKNIEWMIDNPVSWTFSQSRMNHGQGSIPV